ncbi:MAG: adenylate/guanylate cyclase domain-containing protein, partial [Pseudomonadota bacterium]
MSPNPNKVKFSQRPSSLRNILIWPFVIQIFAVVAIIGWLSFTNGQRAVNDIATNLRSEITERIEQHVKNFLELPHKFHEFNHGIFLNQIIDTKDYMLLERHFYDQIESSEDIDYMFLGDEEGNFLGVQRMGPDEIVVKIRNEFTAPYRQIYPIGRRSGPRSGASDISEYDPRTRPWYKVAKETGKPTWSPVYESSQLNILQITPVMPLFSEDGKFDGVLAVNLWLSQISDFLRSLQISKTGRAFIMERNGDIIATSEEEDYLIDTVQADGQITQKRLNALASNQQLVRATSEHLIKQFGSFDNINERRSLSYQLEDGSTELVEVLPIRDGRGLDWLAVVVIPEADFMEHIDANTRLTITLCIVALFLALLFSWMAARWIIEPVIRLKLAAEKLSDGDWEQRLEVERRDELGSLAQAFKKMVEQLRATFFTLEQKNTDLQQAHQQLHNTNQGYARFVPHEFLQFLNKDSVVDVELGDHVQKEMTILFSDIRGFTSLSETMTPDENFRFINSYLSRMEPVIAGHSGFIDKYIGDAIMALFPTSADEAVRGSIDMLHSLSDYNEGRERAGYPLIKIGIGLNTGPLMLGTVGGKNRMDGTVISDAVNLASRVEGLTKTYGTALLITEWTYQRLYDVSQYQTRVIDRVRVKGKTEPVTVYEIF